MKAKWLGVLVFGAAALMGAGSARGEFVRGEINSWGDADPMAQDASYGNIWAVSISSGATRAASDFKFTQHGGSTWQPQWGLRGGESANADKNSNIGRARVNDGGTDPGALSFAETSGNRYTFRLTGESHWEYRDYVVMETDAAPVSITSVGDNHADRDTNTVTVTIGLSASKSAQESLWVRYSRYSNFSSSTLLPSSGSGTNYTATIPGQPSGTSIYYYVLSSTMPSNVITSNFDLCTLRGNNDSGANYSYLVGDPPPDFGEGWHNPAEAVQGTDPAVPMRNPTNPAAGASVFVYAGNYQADSGGANMTNGIVYFRKGASGGWTATNMSFNNEVRNLEDTGWVKNWIAGLPTETYAEDDVLQYVIQMGYDNRDTTYLGTTNQTGTLKYAALAGAQSNAYSVTFGPPPEPVLGNCWHLPGNSEPSGATMRNPRNPFADEAVYIYNGSYGPEGDQSGGTLYYRETGAGSWSSAALAWDSDQGDNKYWRAAIAADTFVPGDSVEYYIGVTFTDRDTTWLGTTNQTVHTAYPAESSAQSNLFTFTYGAASGEEAGFLWHAGNVVKQGDTSAQFWIKVGYAEGSGSNRWVDNVVLYYTTNGAAPVVTGKGTAGADTFTQTLSFSHVEEDDAPEGNAMWWSGIATNLPNGIGEVITYKIGAWNSVYSHDQRFADYRAAEDDQTFEFAFYEAAGEGLEVSIDGGAWVNASYTTSKAFIDEIAGDEVNVRVRYNPDGSGVHDVEVFSNVGRRDLVNVDYTNVWIATNGYPDAIDPPDGNLLTTNDVGSYFRPFAMTHAGGGEYLWETNVTKCGAYRVTARHKVDGQTGTNWTWYAGRDHAVVISPTKAHRLTMYEVNPLTIKATNNDEAGRSTFADLLAGNADSFTNFNLGYLNKMQINCLWFQPIHPSAETTRGDPGGYTPGSPYATRDYFAVSKWFGRAGTETNAMQEFQEFVLACDTNATSVGTINIMLDGVFNHTAWDAVVGQGGADLFSYDPTNSMPGTRPGWYSYWQDYGEPATFYNGVWDNDIAVAPDRGDFGKWLDTADLFFGKYSALVRHNPDNNGDYLNETDVYDFAGMSTDTKDLWKYFGHYATFWLDQTGHSLSNSWVLEEDDLGIDGLRCDFGQGLPPQFWEYFINHTRSMKWNFIFMAETLDGGVPGYRSNRHFDVLNEDILFMFHNDIDADTIRNAVEQRRNSYSGGTILLNQTSHDETMPSEDPWRTASYYGAVSTVDGIPMLFNGQEWGIRPASGEWAGSNTNWGFVHFELNFGKWIPHFKQWNQATFWASPPSLSDGLAQWHGRVNWARLNSPALHGMNRYFLNNMAGYPDSRILSVAKYETAYAGPADSDVVLAFALVLGDPHASASATYNLQGAWDVLGMDTAKTYRVRNLASSDAYAYLTDGWPQSGQDLWDNGIYVGFSAGVGGAITDDGALVQYLKLEEVQPGEETTNSPVPVPYTWIDGYYPGAHSAQDYEDIAVQTASNGFLLVWQSYTANLDPTDPEAYFLFQVINSEGSGLGNAITLPVTEDRAYRIEFTDSALNDEPVTWEAFTSGGSWTNAGPTYETTHTFYDDGTAGTSGTAFGDIRIYRVWVGLP